MDADGNSNLCNPILASFVAKKLLPYRGLGSGILRALEAWPQIEFQDDREGCLFKVTVWRPVHQAQNTITADQRQQIATIVGSLLKDAGSLAPSDLLAVAKVNEALAAPEDKPEARNLLGKVWHGLKEVVDVTKTGTDIAGFVLEHQAVIAGAITMAVAALK